MTDSVVGVGKSAAFLGPSVNVSPRFACSCGHAWSAGYAISCPKDADDGARHAIRFVNYIDLCGDAAFRRREPIKKEP